MVKAWIEKNGKPLIKGEVISSFYGKGFYPFYFENTLDRDLVFKTGPYFMGAQGLYLDHLTPSFNPECDVSSSVLVWLKFPYLPLHCWNDVTFRLIGNSLGK